MPIRVLVNGAQGRMGRLTVDVLNTQSDLVCVAQTGRADDLKSAIEKNRVDVVIDFTSPDGLFETVNKIIDANVHPVIGTSGLSSEHIQLLQEKSKEKKLGGLIVPNFSIGAVLMMRYAQEMVHYMPDVEIIEMHHAGKKDAPSGTAIKTAELLAAARQNNVSILSETILSPARGAMHAGIPIHAIRLPGLLAHQQIIFGGVNETLKITHDTLSREAFMPGVCLACRRVGTLNTLVYGLEGVMN